MSPPLYNALGLAEHTAEMGLTSIPTEHCTKSNVQCTRTLCKVFGSGTNY